MLSSFVALSVEFDPTEYTVSEADSFANLTVKASVPASFDYDVVITTEDITTTGKACLMVIIVSCAYVCVCVCVCVCTFSCILCMCACVCVCVRACVCVCPCVHSSLSVCACV